MKNMISKKNIIKLIIISLIVIFLGILFFKFRIIFNDDSIDYYYLALIFEGTYNFSDWWIVRGPTFPLLIFLVLKILGTSNNALLFGLFLCYLLLAYGGYKILKLLLKSSLNLNKIIIYSIYVIFILLNPLIMGYSHTLLTEALIPGVFLINCYFAYKMSTISFKNNKIKYFLSILYICFILIFVWFMKQPYIFGIFSVFLVCYFLIWLKEKTWKNLLQKIIPLFIGIISLIIAINLWNIFLINYQVQNNNTDNTNGLITSTFIRMIGNNYREVQKQVYCNEDYLQNLNFNKKDKTTILNYYKKDKTCNNFKIYNIYNGKDKIIDQTYLLKNNENVNLRDGLNFFLTNTLKKPQITLNAFYKSYLGSLNINDIVINQNNYYATGTSNFKNIIQENSENNYYGLAIYEPDEIIRNYWWTKVKLIRMTQPDFYKSFDYIQQYKKDNIASENTINFFNKLSIISLISYTILFLIVPLIIIYSLIMYIKKKYNIIYLFVNLLSSVAYINLIMHVLMGTILDRYIYPGYPLIILSCICLLINKQNIKD